VPSTTPSPSPAQPTSPVPSTDASAQSPAAS
jgi:hypothetical protein